MKYVQLLTERDWARFDQKVAPEPNTGCHLWYGGRAKNGYGLFAKHQRPQQYLWYAHRLAFYRAMGPIPAGKELDHRCRVRLCVNPEHLEPVIRAVNVARGRGPAMLGARNASKTHCAQGHLYDGANTRLRPTGGRACRACAREAQRRWRGILEQHTAPDAIRSVADR